MSRGARRRTRWAIAGTVVGLTFALIISLAQTKAVGGPIHLIGCPGSVLAIFTGAIQDTPRVLNWNSSGRWLFLFAANGAFYGISGGIVFALIAKFTTDRRKATGNAQECPICGHRSVTPSSTQCPACGTSNVFHASMGEPMACTYCGYNLSGSETGTCPECGEGIEA